MKKLLVILFAIGLSLPILAQRGEADFFKTLSRQSSIHPVVKRASIGLSKNSMILDSLLYFTNMLEKAVLEGKPANAIKPDLVKTAQKRYPGNTQQAVRNRLKLYATEGKK